LIIPRNLNRIISKKDGIISINPFLNQTYAIYGVDGKLLVKNQITPKNGNIKLNLSEGTYILKTTSENNECFERFLIEK